MRNQDRNASVLVVQIVSNFSSVSEHRPWRNLITCTDMHEARWVISCQKEENLISSFLGSSRPRRDLGKIRGGKVDREQRPRPWQERGQNQSHVAGDETGGSVCSRPKQACRGWRWWRCCVMKDRWRRQWEGDQQTCQWVSAGLWCALAGRRHSWGWLSERTVTGHANGGAYWRWLRPGGEKDKKRVQFLSVMTNSYHEVMTWRLAGAREREEGHLWRFKR